MNSATPAIGSADALSAVRQRLIDCLAPTAPADSTVPRGLYTRAISGVRFVPGDAAVLKAVAADFDRKVLLETNCFEEDGEGGVQLISGLTHPASPVIVLQASPEEPPYAIAADGRPVTSPPLAVDFFRDVETRRLIQKFGGLVIATADVNAAVAWRRVGLAAMPIADLAHHSDATVARVWSGFNAMEPLDSARVQEARRELKYSSWDNSSPGLRLKIQNWRKTLTLDAAVVIALWNPCLLSAAP